VCYMLYILICDLHWERIDILESKVLKDIWFGRKAVVNNLKIYGSAFTNMCHMKGERRSYKTKVQL